MRKTPRNIGAKNQILVVTNVHIKRGGSGTLVPLELLSQLKIPSCIADVVELIVMKLDWKILLWLLEIDTHTWIYK